LISPTFIWKIGPRRAAASLRLRPHAVLVTRFNRRSNLFRLADTNIVQLTSLLIPTSDHAIPTFFSPIQVAPSTFRVFTGWFWQCLGFLLGRRSFVRFSPR